MENDGIRFTKGRADCSYKKRGMTGRLFDSFFLEERQSFAYFEKSFHKY